MEQTMTWTRGALATFLLVSLFWASVVPAVEKPEAVEAEGPRVARMITCTAVEAQEPIGAADRFPADAGRLFCFTEMRDAEGTKIVHAWIHEGTTRARVELQVKSPRWRTWSSKRLPPEWTGQWEVKVLSEDGLVLETVSFVVE